MPGFSAGVLRGSRAWSEPDNIFLVDICTTIIALYARIGVKAMRIRRANVREFARSGRLPHLLLPSCPSLK
jgi:hypothetical protein